MRARVSRRVSWGLLTAVLASTPYTVFNITGPAIPLHFTLTPLCLAAAASVLTRWVMGARKDAHVRTLFVLAWVSTACLVCLEAYAYVRGYSYLTSAGAVRLNTVLAGLELAAASSALTFWSLSAPSPGNGGFCGGCLVCMAVGAVLPALVFFTAGLFPSLVPPVSFGLCVGVGSFVFALVVWGPMGRIGQPGCFGVLAGMISYQILTCFVWGSAPYYGFYSGVPSMLAPFLFLLALASVYLGKRYRLHVRGCEGSGRAVRDCSAEVRQQFVLEGSAASDLSPRERSVVSALACGRSYRDISASLGISEHTVATYRARAFGKLNISEIGELHRLIALGELAMREEGDSGPLRTGEMRRAPFTRVAGIAALAALLVILIGDFPFQVELPNGQILYQVPYYTSWGLAVALFMVAASLIDSRPYHGAALSESVSISLRFVLVLEPVVLGFQLGGFATTGPIGSIAALALCGFPVIGYLVLRRGSVAASGMSGSSWSALVDQVGKLGDARILVAVLLASSLVISKTLGPYPVTWILKDVCQFALLATSVCWLVHVSRGQRAACEAPLSRDDELIAVLRAHGLGELQTMVALDCVNGLSIKETAVSRHTTQNTVKSYRKRIYRQFGVGSAQELRYRLNSELDTTKGGTLHP